MTKRYDYKVFPQTWKMKLVLALAFIAYPFIGLGSAILLTISLESFETGVWVTFENRSERDVIVLFDGNAAGGVSRNSENDVFLRYKGFSSNKHLIHVVTSHGGRELLELEIGRPGLADRDWRIVIEGDVEMAVSPPEQ